jgi:hypothetical protein
LLLRLTRFAGSADRGSSGSTDVAAVDCEVFEAVVEVEEVGERVGFERFSKDEPARDADEEDSACEGCAGEAADRP